MLRGANILTRTFWTVGGWFWYLGWGRTRVSESEVMRHLVVRKKEAAAKTVRFKACRILQGLEASAALWLTSVRPHDETVLTAHELCESRSAEEVYESSSNVTIAAPILRAVTIAAPIVRADVVVVEWTEFRSVDSFVKFIIERRRERERRGRLRRKLRYGRKLKHMCQQACQQARQRLIGGVNMFAWPFSSCCTIYFVVRLYKEEAVSIGSKLSYAVLQTTV